MKFPGSIKVRVEVPGLPISFATSLKVKDTPEKTVEWLNKESQRQGIGAVYTLATQEEYDAYRGRNKV